MALKHFIDYYNKTLLDYREMNDTLTEMQKAFEENVISAEKLENVKQATEKIKENYRTLSWVMYLLNQPQRDKKETKYKRYADPLIKKIDPEKSRSPEAILNENKQELNKLKNMI